MEQVEKIAISSLGNFDEFLHRLSLFCTPVMWLNSNKSGKKLLAIGEERSIKVNSPKWDRVDSFFEPNDWYFGVLSYDLKNSLEPYQSNNYDGIEQEDISFFVPQWVLEFDQDYFLIQKGLKNDWNSFSQSILSKSVPTLENNSISLRQKVSQHEYLEAVNTIQNHIARGDIFELNYCIEWSSENATFSPVHTYKKLNQLGQAPFSCYARINDIHIMSGSPERYVQKIGNTIISQPIKGTKKRGGNAQEDQELITSLRNDPKEQSENVMIVDLVRNDLSKIAHKGTVKVDELFGIYSFKTVHQMISTVSCKVDKDLKISELLKATFPMGSMTGAPKPRAMELIEKYEKTKRGIYSGSVGYITPTNDFDFNVIIRSIIYNAKTKYASAMVGSAITSEAIAQNEYDECLLKVNSMIQALNNEE